MTTIKVPLWIDVNKKPKEERSALDMIVYEQCPLSKEEDLEFQEQLQDLVDEVYNKGYNDGFSN